MFRIIWNDFQIFILLKKQIKTPAQTFLINQKLWKYVQKKNKWTKRTPTQCQHT